MDKNALTTAMTASISEVLETMFFMPVDVISAADASPATDLSADTHVVRLDFSGPSTGFFQLCLPADLARDVASDFLGVAPEAVTPEDMRGTAKEMVNMLAGNTLSHYDPAAVFDLGVPETASSREGGDDPQDGASGVFLDIQALSNRMAMAVFIWE